MDWYLEVRIQARDRQYSFCPLIPETKAIKILQRLISTNHVEHSICTVLRRNIKTRYFGLMLILRFKKNWHSIRLDRMQLSFKNTSSSLHSKSCEIEDWRSFIWEFTHVSSTTTKDLITTITIGPKGKFNWVLRLINSQKVKLFDSHEENFNTQRSPN